MTYSIKSKKEFNQACNKDLIQLLPEAPGANPVFIEKYKLTALADGIITNQVIHITGPSGTGKTSLINALIGEPMNWQYLCRHLGQKPHKPLHVVSHSAVGFEAAAEVFYRRAISPGQGTYDEPSPLLNEIKKLLQKEGDCHKVVWVSEMLRMPGQVQSAFVELINGKMTDSKGQFIGWGNGLAWIFDSNYQAANDENFHFELSRFDEALKARNTVVITMDYLSIEQEVEIMKSFLPHNGSQQKVTEQMLYRLAEVASLLRKAKNKGEFASLPMPTLRQYQAFLQMASMQHISEEDLYEITLFGFASPEDLGALKEMYEGIKYKNEMKGRHYKFRFQHS